MRNHHGDSENRSWNITLVGMKRRLVSVGAAAVVLLFALVAGWHWWPRDVAPGLTPQMVRVINSSGHQNITFIDGGSRRDAHTLWNVAITIAPLTARRPHHRAFWESR